jgi:hypothetical protein
MQPHLPVALAKVLNVTQCLSALNTSIRRGRPMALEGALMFYRFRVIYHAAIVDCTTVLLKALCIAIVKQFLVKERASCVLTGDFDTRANMVDAQRCFKDDSRPHIYVLRVCRCAINYFTVLCQAEGLQLGKGFVSVYSDRAACGTRAYIVRHDKHSAESCSICF